MFDFTSHILYFHTNIESENITQTQILEIPILFYYFSNLNKEFLLKLNAI